MGRRFVQAGMDHDAFVVADGGGYACRAIHQVGELVEHVDANLLVLDTLRRLAPKMRENESDDTPVMAALADLFAADQLRGRDDPPPLDQVGRGGHARILGDDMADLVFVLEKVEGDPEIAARRRLRSPRCAPTASRDRCGCS